MCVLCCCCDFWYVGCNCGGYSFGYCYGGVLGGVVDFDLGQQYYYQCGDQLGEQEFCVGDDLCVCKVDVVYLNIFFLLLFNVIEMKDLVQYVMFLIVVCCLVGV